MEGKKSKEGCGRNGRAVKGEERRRLKSEGRKINERGIREREKKRRKKRKVVESKRERKKQRKNELL